MSSHFDLFIYNDIKLSLSWGVGSIGRKNILLAHSW